MRICIFFIGLFCLSCNLLPRKDKAPSIHIVNPELKEFTNRFLDSLIAKYEKEKNITIYIEKMGDTTAISAINSLPDPDMAKINGMLNLRGFYIYMTGLQLEKFYRFQPGEFHVLDKAILNRHETEISSVKFSEPLVWNIYFINDSVI